MAMDGRTGGIILAGSHKVRFHLDSQSSLSPRSQIHEELINYVHLGILTPGMRLPTVRELAAQTGLNLKTAFRIYRSLARDDFVDIRPQHGVFVKFSPQSARRSYRSRREMFLRRVFREARQYNLSPRRLSQLLAAEAKLRQGQGLRCAVLECNREQTRLFSQELRRKLKLDAFPVLTNGSAQRRERALRRADVFITTDFHWEEATRWAARHHREVYRIRLNPAFHRLLVRNARRGLFPLILTDVSFEMSFRRVLAATVQPSVVERLVFVHYRDRARLEEVLRQARCAYVSPLCYQDVAGKTPARVRLVTLQDMISRESVQDLSRNLGPRFPAEN